jgi:hypothetical protein
MPQHQPHLMDLLTTPPAENRLGLCMIIIIIVM